MQRNSINMSTINDPVEIRKKAMATCELADVLFVLGKNRTVVPAYRQILSLSNPVFKEMFSNKKFNQEKKIEIPEFEALDFQIVLNYLYFKEVNLKQVNCFNVYAIAHKYMVDPLCQLCEKEIQEVIGLHNVFAAYEWNRKYQIEDLSIRIKRFFCKNVIGCLKINAGFKYLSKSSLMDFLSWDNIHCSEELLYENLLIWVKHQLTIQKQEITIDNVKKLLTDFLPLIQIKINDDLSMDSFSYSTSRFNWPTTIPDNQRQTLYRYDDLTCQEKTVLFGVKMLFSNFSSSPILEEFKIFIFTSINDKRTKVFEEGFKVRVKDSMSSRDIYFKRPLVIEAGPVELVFQYETSMVRMPQFQKNSSWTDLCFLSVPFIHKLHNIYIEDPSSIILE